MIAKRNIGVVAATLVIGSLGIASAQIAVSDTATTLKNAAIAALKEQVIELLTEQGRRLRRMARRLSASTNLGKYTVPEPPRWRIYRYQDTNLYANVYADALNGGDPEGHAYAAVSRSRVAPGAELSDLPPGARMALLAALATLDVTDSVIITGTDRNGQLRPTGKLEMRALEALDRDVTDPSGTQSATAVLDKLSAAGLIETRQNHSRLQFLTAIVEQMLVENKRARDTEAAAMNMQLRRIASDATQRQWLSGAAADLRNWRQP